MTPLQRFGIVLFIDPAPVNGQECRPGLGPEVASEMTDDIDAVAHIGSVVEDRIAEQSDMQLVIRAWGFTGSAPPFVTAVIRAPKMMRSRGTAGVQVIPNRFDYSCESYVFGRDCPRLV